MMILLLAKKKSMDVLIVQPKILFLQQTFSKETVLLSFMVAWMQKLLTTTVMPTLITNLVLPKNKDVWMT